MLISAAPVAIPVTTANPPTEAVAAEAAQKTPIPKPASATDTPSTKNSTEANEQPKSNQTTQNAVAEKESSKDEREQSSRQSEQQRKEQREATQEQKQINQLRRTDREVRAHETAHASVGGQLAGAPSLSFVIGPDGKRYAVAGEVSIDTSKVANDPQATVEKMLQVQRAALAPVNPSNQDFKVAAIASQVANQARIEVNLQRNEKLANPLADKEDSKESQPNLKNSSIRFSNPVAARRASLILEQKLARSGAFEPVDDKPLFSQRA